jgi:RNA polymerase sigma-70 factor (ECF subfamily)
VDQITVEAARQGDRAAQARLLQQLQDPWFRMCMGLLDRSEDARDAVQETALRFLRQLPQFRGESSIMTWSMGIAVNVAREIRRKKRPMQPFEADMEPPIRTHRHVESPDEHAASSEAHRVLWGTLNELPQRQREALLLRYFQQLSVEETAVAMDCAVGTVKATVHQALRSLRAKLGEPT